MIIWQNNFLIIVWLTLQTGILTAPAMGTPSVDAAQPREFFVDNPTYRHLAFRWLVGGDANRNAQISVFFREVGSREWRPALPLEEMASLDSLRLFAGSILNLEPDTAYEVRLDLQDPDGGGASRLLTVATRRPLPDHFLNTRKMHVFPENVQPSSEPFFAGGLKEAFERAGPGGEVLIHAGTYIGPFLVRAAGTVDQPVVFRAAGDGEVILENQEQELVAVITGEKESRHLVLDGLTLRKRGAAPIIQGWVEGWIIRHCLIFGGINVYGKDWTVSDNVIIGRHDQWRQRLHQPGGTGIKLRGRGHVVTHNRISYFWDGISTAHLFDADESWAFQENGRQHAFDIEHNLIFAIVDDAIEADNVVTNVRVMHNRVMNSLVGISLQSTGPGPVYVTHNVLSNFSQQAWKMFGRSSGLRLYHNTSLEWYVAAQTTSPHLANTIAENNVFLSYLKGVYGGARDKLTRFNHNAYCQPQAGTLFRWTADGGRSWQSYDDLKELALSTGQELDGRVVEPREAFIGRVYFDSQRDYDSWELDMRPAYDGPLIDAGRLVPTVNDDFSGQAPELGAYEAGSEVPLYGPRESFLIVGLNSTTRKLALSSLAAIGATPLNLKERLVLFIDQHNISVPTIALASCLVGVIIGVMLTTLVMRERLEEK